MDATSAPLSLPFQFFAEPKGGAAAHLRLDGEGDEAPRAGERPERVHHGADGRPHEGPQQPDAAHGEGEAREHRDEHRALDRAEDLRPRSGAPAELTHN